MKDKKSVQRKIFTSCLFGGCLTITGIAQAQQDPLEVFNRTMFAFNKATLEYVVNPIADYATKNLPPPMLTSLGNAYSNLTEVEFILNNLLRGDPHSAGISAGRFAINSTLGIAGLFDVASPLGWHRKEYDFIESLCKAGVPPGPYIVLPLVGAANAFSAATLAAAVAIEVYGLSFISTTLAAADFIIIDLGGSASSLRYMNNIPNSTTRDPYEVLRDEHLAYVKKGCGNL